MRSWLRWPWLPARRVAGTAAVGVVVVTAGMLAGAGPAAGAQTSRVALNYGCLFPSGTHPVGVVVDATFPDSAVPGAPVQPDDVTATITVGPDALVDLTASGAVLVAADPQLAVAVTHDGDTAQAAWSALAAEPTPVPVSGELTLVAAGAVPPVSVDTPGDVTFTAADLALVLTLRAADGVPTDPSALPVACTLSGHQDAVLAVVPVAGPAVSPEPPGTGSTTREPTAPATPTASARPGLSGQPAPPRPGQAESAAGATSARHGSIAVGPVPDGRRAPATVRPDAGVADCGAFPPDLPPPGAFGINGCAGLAGFSNVTKLNGAAFLGGTPRTPLLLKAVIGFEVEFPGPDNDFTLTLVSAAKLDFRGRPEFPPSQATFLTFGFVPTTATMHLTETGLIDIRTSGPATSTSSVTTARATFVLRLDNVLVNGVPLDVGPNCRTVGPLHSAGEDQLVLTGIDEGDGKPYNLTLGGPLTGTATIPPFTGCGVGEDLDPIFTAAVSGPGNFIQMTQGPFCTDGQPQFCPPRQVKPQR